MSPTQLQVSQLLPDLPKDIVTAILLLLPVKSICKFRCVSKSWLSLISSSRFVKDHIKISTKNNIYTHDRLIFGSESFDMDLYACPIRRTVEEFVFNGHFSLKTVQDLLVHEVGFNHPLYEQGDVLSLIGSCNGLICVFLYAENLILWNPTTGKSKSLPNSGTDLDYDYYGISFGFGYDDTRDDYKVVEFFSFERVSGSGTLEIQVKVYSLRDNSWKTLLDWPGGDTFGGSGKYLNGAIHWSVSDYDGIPWTIISHDLANDNFKVLKLPILEDNDVRVEVKVLEGCLALCCEHNTYMDVWLMKEYGVTESWNKVVRVPFFLDLRDHEYVRPKPLFLLSNGRILMNYGTNINIYDPINPQIHHFFEGLKVEAITYFESLVSPDLDNGTHALDRH